MQIRKAILGITLLLTGLGVAGAQNQGLDQLIEPIPQSEQPAEPSSQQAREQPEVQRFQDWGVRCGTLQQTGERACEMFQVVTETESGKQVMAIVIGYPPQVEQPVAMFQLPLGIHLPPGVQLSIDGGEPVSFPVQVCVPQGCRAPLLLEDGLVDQMRAGARGTITIHGPRGQEVELPFSLMGFTAALEKVMPD